MVTFIEKMWARASEINEANLACEPTTEFNNEKE
jgi:hypothetical protein